MGFKTKQNEPIESVFPLALKGDFITKQNVKKTIKELVKSIDQILFACNVCFWSNNVSDETYLTSVFRLRWQNEKTKKEHQSQHNPDLENEQNSKSMFSDRIQSVTQQWIGVFDRRSSEFI